MLVFYDDKNISRKMYSRAITIAIFNSKKTATLCVSLQRLHFETYNSPRSLQRNSPSDHSHETLNIHVYVFLHYILQNTLHPRRCLRVKNASRRCDANSPRLVFPVSLATRFTDGWWRATTGSNRQRNSRFCTRLEKWMQQENAFPRTRAVRATYAHA